MRVKCKECGGKGRISSRDEVSPLYARLYCQCLDARCGHTWVAELSYSHTLTPSSQQQDRMLLEQLKLLPAQRQQELFAEIGVRPTATGAAS